MDYDFIIIGAGPAGSTLARLLPSKYRVLLVDRKDLSSPDYRPKACGGLINSDMQRELAVQNLALPKSVIANPMMFGLTMVDFDNNLVKTYQKHYINIYRNELDRWLYSLVGENIDKLSKTNYISCEEIDGGLRVCFIKEGEKLYFTCRRLIAADGASSKIRTYLRKNKAPGTVYVCPSKFYALESKVSSMFAFFDRGITDYYSWGIPKDDGILIGSAVNDREKAEAKFAELVEKIKDYGIKLGEVRDINGSILIRPMNIGDIEYGNMRIQLVGEAAGLISPSSSEGLSYALKSARVLASEINESIIGYENRYVRSLKPIRNKLMFKAMQSKLMYSAGTRNIIAKSGIFSL